MDAPVGKDEIVLVGIEIDPDGDGEGVVMQFREGRNIEVRAGLAIEGDGFAKGRVGADIDGDLAFVSDEGVVLGRSASGVDVGVVIRTGEFVEGPVGDDISTGGHGESEEHGKGEPRFFVRRTRHGVLLCRGHHESGRVK